MGYSPYSCRELDMTDHTFTYLFNVFIGLPEKFVLVFPYAHTENLNELFSQPSITMLFAFNLNFALSVFICSLPHIPLCWPASSFDYPFLSNVPQVYH